ncbi:SPP2 [Scenedesmus sp. PABB004]|nr:SPP2 [Scenedesmus sp. PABB004]
MVGGAGASPHPVMAVSDAYERHDIANRAGQLVTVNKVAVGVPPAFYLFYATGWRHCNVTYKMLKDGHPVDPAWQRQRRGRRGGAPPRRRPRAGLRRWRAEGSPAELKGVCKVDMPGKSSPSPCYTLRWPGGWKLQDGAVTKFNTVTAPPIMLVSDIDGTMVNESGDKGTQFWMDARTKEFQEYWESSAALARSVLVYNTGRSKGQLIWLLKEKPMLAVPDVLITAVGTKIWYLPDGMRAFQDPTEVEWIEDTNWSRRLDEGWDLQQALSAAGEMLKSFNRDAGERVKWLDKGQEHPHRVALQVHTAVLDDLMDRLQAGIDKRDLQARIITSGAGDWRYVDVVHRLAGKLEALEWVRQLYGVPVGRVATAGDSCNDILMLDGKMPAIIVGNAQEELVRWYHEQNDRGRIVLTDKPEAAGAPRPRALGADSAGSGAAAAADGGGSWTPPGAWTSAVAAALPSVDVESLAHYTELLQECLVREPSLLLQDPRQVAASVWTLERALRGSAVWCGPAAVSALLAAHTPASLGAHLRGLVDAWLAAGGTPHEFGGLFLEAPRELAARDGAALAAHLAALQANVPDLPVAALLTSSISLAGAMLSLESPAALREQGWVVRRGGGYLVIAPHVRGLVLREEARAPHGSAAGGGGGGEAVLAVYGVCAAAPQPSAPSTSAPSDGGQGPRRHASPVHGWQQQALAATSRTAAATAAARPF